MRVLALETTSPRCSVALVEHGKVVCSLQTSEPSARAEHTLETLDRALQHVGWPRSSLERVVVGIGPGSFTGVRVGIALAEGIATGIGVPLIGIGSLRAMALGAPSSEPRIRCPVLDARRDETFVAAYSPVGEELWAPRMMPQNTVQAALLQAFGPNLVLLGVVAEELVGPEMRLCDELTLYPSAEAIALAAPTESISPEAVLPLYIRDADATLPNLPPSPLANEPLR